MMWGVFHGQVFPDANGARVNPTCGIRFLRSHDTTGL
jgi:hypothetical protein